jgi:2-polyprenyl-6-methoxyphenol hydroxylase-like FAD-dependent oxidoreductase
MRIACVGGGPAGLYFALLMKLRQAEHDITVFERSAAGGAPGWGVTFGGDLLQTLYNCDAESAREIDRAAYRWVNQVVDVEGRQAQHAGGDGYAIGRQRMLTILADRAADLGVQLEFGHEVTAPSQLPAADLVVACDGMNSRVRLAAATFGTDVRLGANKYIWLGTSKVFKSFMYGFVPTRSGWLWAYGYGTGAESSTFIVECAPATWAGLGFGSMPLRDSLSCLQELFARQLDGHQLLGPIGAGRGQHWTNFPTVTNQRWHDGKVVLAGDAAHTTHYSIGWGTRLAIEDAISLAGNLRDHPDLQVALRSYEKQRRAALLPAQSDARLSARWFENLSRYIDLEPGQFSTLLHGRRSPLLPQLPPRLYCRLLGVAEEATVLRKLRTSVAPRAKRIYGRYKLTYPGKPFASSADSSRPKK